MEQAKGLFLISGLRHVLLLLESSGEVNSYGAFKQVQVEKAVHVFATFGKTILLKIISRSCLLLESTRSLLRN